jgi:hypothetical protein
MPGSFDDFKSEVSERDFVSFYNQMSRWGCFKLDRRIETISSRRAKIFCVICVDENFSSWIEAFNLSDISDMVPVGVSQ